MLWYSSKLERYFLCVWFSKYKFILIVLCVWSLQVSESERDLKMICNIALCVVVEPYDSRLLSECVYAHCYIFVYCFLTLLLVDYCLYASLFLENLVPMYRVYIAWCMFFFFSCVTWIRFLCIELIYLRVWFFPHALSLGQNI
jgi:hypothetical protein